MPGGKKTRHAYTPDIEIEVSPVAVKRLEDDEWTAVEGGRTYFTDEQITLALTVRNQTGKTVTGTGNAAIRWLVQHSIAEDQGERRHTEEFELAPGESTTKKATHVIPFQGNVGVGVPVPPSGDSIVKEETVDEIILDPSHPRAGIDTLYSFRVWDREEYEQTYEIPKRQNETISRLTRGLLILTFILVVVSLIQAYPIIVAVLQWISARIEIPRKLLAQDLGGRFLVLAALILVGLASKNR